MLALYFLWHRMPLYPPKNSNIRQIFAFATQTGDRVILWAAFRDDVKGISGLFFFVFWLIDEWRCFAKTFTFLDLFLQIYVIIQPWNKNPVLCIVPHHKWTVSLHPCCVSQSARTKLFPFISSANQARASLFFNSKTKCESYIFYKLSAVKEGAKIKTINTVHNYHYLLPQPGIVEVS